ncbi:hypothetical protein ACM61V_06945 [Sphingomonas sp. TX0543]|uniref:hypothetical protein n=1 Tax=unclassified Sphingomonas TaxID=196159 RepID=UPI0010F4D0A6|nr:hypothetical protein [Sphingomonas sp. 3P27F8]
MALGRIVIAGLGAGALFAGTPAAAQFFMQSKDLSGTAVVGNEPGLGPDLPGATLEEQKAAVIWNVRAALNVAALQCQFEPTLTAVSNYNAMLVDHKTELKQSWDTLSKYFARMNKAPKAAQNALDQFGTRTYSSFTTVAAQYNFCMSANDVGREVVFAPRGGFGTVALQRIRLLRNSLKPWGEQRFPRFIYPQTTLPRLDDICWKNGDWQVKKCGAQNFPPAGVGVAQR